MHNYKLTIQYDGSRYKGWQRLGNGENTIQAKIEQVLSLMAGEEIEIIGSGRTDAGVHALGQFANFKMGKNMTEKEILTYTNQYLPHDISIINVEQVSNRYHARYHTSEKTYLYKIWNTSYPNPFLRKYSSFIQEPLNVDAMKEAAVYFIGEHDFTAFSNAKSKKKSKVREIYSLEMVIEKELIEIYITGNGFLYNMVRKIVGTLIEVGLGNIEAKDIPAIIEAKERNQTGRMAEASGLYLM
ncbi:tRNA pseudouridine(38-40) synthase TruA [Alkalihalobacillus trypoxylicola]|uniref:tRNA pseudouridine synthase A n=1 Tax=Alkalihalobacillus trypoxylicola TaxID=519424 RepID=A0A162EZI5_9BACI|nr:tRNA pseudouridine(38-40) synthase TruA [Alkalihalobacillus trypoxylicola]KYG34112.1 tRNA pseudouridine synthase A [Alkalihalobacillus trypoxylicola]